MLKVLHTGDWHIGSFPGPEVGGQNARFQDICRCLDFQAMYAEEHRPDLIVVSGDIFHQARVWSDRGLRESRTAIDHIRRLSNVAPTVVLRGTPNHDSEEQFEMLTTAFYGDDSVSVVTEPEVLHIHTYHGQRVDVACIPGFDRGVHRAAHPGLSREEETQVFTDELAKVVLGLKAQCEPGVTSILSTHFTVPGCNMESGQTALFAQFEPVIYPATLKAADFDLVALGHIHRPQQLPEAGRAVFYCGSITGLNFNDENQPRGFYIHDIDDDGEAWSEYVETPYREFETIRLGEDDVRAMLSAERVVVPDRLKGKIVRVLYTCSDETNKAFNKAVLEKRLYDGGVFYVSEITPEEITTSVNRDELHGDNSPERNLAEYLAEKEKSPEDAQRIIELARPIISEAMEKGRLETPTGLFMPVEIEVKNYRNYRDELFSYDGIRCGPLIKAIDAYLAKAENDLYEQLTMEGYLKAKESLNTVDEIEEVVTKLLEDNADDLLKELADAIDLETFFKDNWPKFKNKSKLSRDLFDVFHTQFSTIMPTYVEAYVQKTDAELTVTKLTKRTTDWICSTTKTLLASVRAMRSSTASRSWTT